MQLPISSDDCSLLLHFSEAESLAALARSQGRDISVISRKLQRLAAELPVIEKHRGRWALTPLGREIVQWTRDAVTSQSRLLQRPLSLRIATTREFAARILAPALPDLQKRLPLVEFEIYSFEGGTEKALLEGNVDLSFDCGRPHSPDIRFQLLAREEVSLFASPAFLKRFPLRRVEDLQAAPHVEFLRLPPSRYLQLKNQLENRFARFNDIAACRAAAVSSCGWALLPAYAVRDELENGKLKALDLFSVEQENYGLWWLRDRKTLKPYLQVLSGWLKEIKL